MGYRPGCSKAKLGEVTRSRPKGLALTSSGPFLGEEEADFSFFEVQSGF